MEKHVLWELVTDQLPETEKEKVWEAIKASPALTEQYQELKRAWALSAASEDMTDHQLDDKFKEFNRSYRSISPSTSLGKSILKYVALVAISLASSYFLWQKLNPSQGSDLQVSRVVAEQGSTNHFILSDGSQIWLNSGSNITFKSQSHDRVELELHGEALFYVIHNDDRQFVVNLGDLQVMDLGTRFNLRNYNQDNEVLATLIEGEIAVSDNTHAFSEQLRPGQQLRYNKDDGSYLLEKIDTTYVGAWKDEKFRFVDKALRDIAIDIENWYGVKVEFKNKKLADEHFTGVIQKSTSVKQVMEILAYSSGIKYSINEQNEQIKIVIK